jgi:L-seryl-tRNA(Ser) seleniumtransferase
VRQDYDAIPALRMIYATAEEIRTRAESFVDRLGSIPGTTIDIVEDRSVIGGGTAPNKTLPTFVIALSSDRYTAEQLQERLRTQSLPVIARIEDDRLMLDLRTVFEHEERALSAGIRAAC